MQLRVAVTDACLSAQGIAFYFALGPLLLASFISTQFDDRPLKILVDRYQSPISLRIAILI